MLQRPDDHRRKWNREEYERIALQRLQDEIAEEELGIPKQPAVKRELLKQRDYKVDLESKLGKSVVINKNTPSSQTGGYYCNVCDCVVKDSINFLDHINGTKRKRNVFEIQIKLQYFHPSLATFYILLLLFYSVTL